MGWGCNKHECDAGAEAWTAKVEEMSYSDRPWGKHLEVCPWCYEELEARAEAAEAERERLKAALREKREGIEHFRGQLGTLADYIADMPAGDDILADLIMEAPSLECPDCARLLADLEAANERADREAAAVDECNKNRLVLHPAAVGAIDYALAAREAKDD